MGLGGFLVYVKVLCKFMMQFKAGAVDFIMSVCVCVCVLCVLCVCNSLGIAVNICTHRYIQYISEKTSDFNKHESNFRIYPTLKSIYVQKHMRNVKSKLRGTPLK